MESKESQGRKASKAAFYHSEDPNVPEDLRLIWKRLVNTMDVLLTTEKKRSDSSL